MLNKTKDSSCLNGNTCLDSQMWHSAIKLQGTLDFYCSHCVSGLYRYDDNSKANIDTE